MNANLCILVVEDDAIFRDEIERILRQSFASSDLVLATNGAEGLQKCLGQSFDLIVTDWRMPILNGLEMLGLVRARRIHTPAIVASSSDLPPGEISAAGAFLFLPKHELFLLPDFVRRLIGSRAD